MVFLFSFLFNFNFPALFNCLNNQFWPWWSNTKQMREHLTMWNGVDDDKASQIIIGAQFAFVNRKLPSEWIDEFRYFHIQNGERERRKKAPAVWLEMVILWFLFQHFGVEMPLFLIVIAIGFICFKINTIYRAGPFIVYWKWIASIRIRYFGFVQFASMKMDGLKWVNVVSVIGLIVDWKNLQYDGMQSISTSMFGFETFNTGLFASKKKNKTPISIMRTRFIWPTISKRFACASSFSYFDFFFVFFIRIYISAV